jgi:predicted HAD superfamily hydrolase
VKSYSLLSFDIWDTVLRRKCHPDEIKLYTTRYFFIKYNKLLKNDFSSAKSIFLERCRCEGLIGNLQKKQGFDDEYSLIDVFKLLVSNVTNELLKENHINDISMELFGIEFNHEKEMLYLDGQIVRTLESIEHQKAIFISDFYADKNYIKDLLTHAGFHFPFSEGYVSCEFNYNKRSGKLFKKLHTHLGIKPEEHYHLGDNEHSDVKSPKALGIEALHYYNENEERKRSEFTKKFSQRDNNVQLYVDDFYRSLDTNTNNLIDSSLNKEEKELFILGRRNALFFYVFILYIIEDVIKNQISSVNYFTREGEFFKLIHEAILEHNPLGLELPKPVLLEVSRLATFSPSLREFTLDELMRLWNQYSVQSMKALFLSLDLEIDEYKVYLNKYQINVEEEIQYPWLNEKIVQLFSDLDFIKQINLKLSSKRKLLVKYFEQKGVHEGSNNTAIVDIGWRGTIQDNISYIYKNTNIYGYYIGLFDFINEQPQNAMKSSFIDEDFMKSIRYVSPFEMLCNSPNGSVLNYQKVGSSVIAIKKIDDQENIIHSKYIQYFQQGVISAVPEISEFIKTHAFTSDELKFSVYRQLEELLNNPPKILTKAFFELSHNETFGLGKFIQKKASFPWSTAAKALFTRQGKRDFRKIIESSSWPQGLLVYHNLYFLNQYYNKIINEKIRTTNNNSISINNYEEIIKSQGEMLEERYRAIMEMEQMIIERDQTINEQNSLIEERNNTIVALEEMIKSRDEIINSLKKSENDE